MKIIKAVLLTVAVVLSTSLVPAQIAPFGIQNNDLGPVPSGPPDSIVQLTADTQGLPAVSPDQIPFSGTFWTIMPGFGFPLPFPCPPPGVNLPTYALPDGSFLVDDSATNSTSEADLIWQATEVTNLIGQAQTTVALAQNQPMARAMDDGVPSPGSGGGTGEVITNTPYASPDYGTNLWLEVTGITNVWVNLLLSNTVADVQYQIWGISDLNLTNWVYEGFVFGSEATNWTSTSIATFTPTNNLFLRACSVADDGSGLPLSWQLEYFGTNGVDPNGDPMEDGWSNIQKYQNGMNPNVFYTPPAPQGLNATYDNANSMGIITWLPSPGPVTSYTLVKQDDDTGLNTTFTIAATNTSFVDNLSGDAPAYGPQLIVGYALNANYGTNGSSASASASINGDSDNSYPAATLVTGPTGQLDLVLATPPSDLSAVWIYRQNDFSKATGFDDDYAGDGADSYSSLADGYFEIPAASITNGICVLPDSQMPPFFQFDIFVQTVRSNGLASAWTDPFTIQASTPFVDARSQLKDNLRFILRNTGPSGPFAFGALDYGTYVFPTSHAFASCYSSGENLEFDPLRPLFDNYCYRNFVYDPGKLDDSGFLDTGCYYGNLYFGYNDDSLLSLSNTVTYYFEVADYLAATNPVVPASQITTNNTTWILPPLPGDNVPVGAVNFYGLPYISEEDAYVTNDQVYEVTQYPGDTGTFSGGANVYVQIAQPVFQPDGYYFTQPYGSSMPEQSGFSPTNTTQTIVAGVGLSMTVAGYAKFMVSNTPCYLGQYFDKAYATDTNGNVTTNMTGILSPYGNFFPTQPVPTALVTMPDVDTGQRGTCMVYSVSLQFDKNQDGVMDTSFTGPDATSRLSPFVFWCNNNYDRWDFDALSNTNEQDDVLAGEVGLFNLDPDVPDYDYHDLGGNRVIPCTRDLEDFARLWICGFTPSLLTNLPYGSTVTLSWGDVGYPDTNNPTIDLFTAAGTDGGIEYLTNETSAVDQIDPNVDRYLGRLGPGQSIQMPAYELGFGYNGGHFIWCGVTNGTGRLTLTVSDGNSNVLAVTFAYIQIEDIKQMYERWTVGDKSSVAPLTNAVPVTEGLPNGMSAFRYPSPQNTTTPYILHVHGYNMTQAAKDHFAETEFKRLYWQGYQGRFGAFNWPTADNAIQFGPSELQAWNSAQGLLNKANDLNAIYPGHVYLTVHSLGNVVAGEALRLAGSEQVVNTYIAMQGAVTAHAYDPSTPIYYLYHDSGTPDCYADYWTNGAPCYFNGSAGAGTYVNFFNINDWALNKAWLTFENSKPTLNPSYGFIAPSSYYKNFYNTELFFPTNTYELFANLIQAKSYALGMQPGVGGAFSTARQVELDIPPYNFGDEHIYHSGEFRSDNSQRWQFWNEILVEMEIK